ncbi:hypothetical protein SAMN05216386_0709 [Nitrosospira briensis]|uniref:Uncharacterized protein n=2 Tax=Nitrosospira briensis TaxID=35799 RepID=A0A1I4YI00_9PROT|nr:hypothetical protein SAMN05216386_0709 [Nitrosospira briensis]
MPTFLERYVVFKRSSMLFIFSLAYSACAAAQEFDGANMGALSGGAVEMAQDSPFVYPRAMHDQFMPPARGRDHGNRSHYRPAVVLPIPLPMDGISGFNSMYGFQYPGSYMPRDTPLHRFNGYVRCDPPDLYKEAAAGTTAGVAAQRLVKITSTRSLAAPVQSQPCPVYTINGEIPKQKSYNTTATMPSRKPPPLK